MINKIAVITHKNPDYDAICSSSSIAYYLQKESKDNEVYLILEDNKLVNNLCSKINYYRLDDVKDIDFDSIYICDVNEYDRTYGVELINKIQSTKRFLIDHHDKNRKELDVKLENKLIMPTYSSTCEIIVDKFDISKFENNILKNLFMGIISDTAGLTRNVSENTNLMIDKLKIDSNAKKILYDRVCDLTYEQKNLYEQVKTINLGIDNCMIYTLFSDKDITPLIKHPKFDELTKPTDENPISIFIIGIQDNYFIKFKKTENCDTDILSLAVACNGGGHENRCAGRFYSSSLTEVTEKIKTFLNNKEIVKVKKYDSSI